MASQSLSQPSQSSDSNRRQMVRNNEFMEKASWDPRTTEIYIRICVEELQAGNRPGTHFNRTGWESIVRKFSVSTNRKYTRTQLKNRWDSLKKEWGARKTLLRGETGIGWNHEKGTVDASPEWWQRKIQALPEAAKFRERGPMMIHEQEMLFLDVVATGEHAWAPSSGLLPPHMQDESEDNTVQHDNMEDPNIERTSETEFIPQNIAERDSVGGSRRTNRDFPLHIRHKKQKKMSTVDKIARCLERMVDSMQSETSNISSFHW
ncbi:hypothetical protein DH2020_029104 [Rehmannia glutinosa]|uniref:Myb/SANT-like domain-containing protein n=1 Tax=Rehmannia glutinosa TaxID=99300 RepID=A0ABR0VSW3_REHGL